MNVVVAGWAGVGKTTLAGTLARVLRTSGREVLVLEDDPGAVLPIALGCGSEPDVMALPQDLLKRGGPQPGGSDGEATLELAKSPAAIIDDYGVRAWPGVTLLKLADTDPGGIGHSGHTTARKVVTRLLRDRDEAVVIDAIGALTHLPAGAIEAVDVVLVVVEPNYRAMEVGRRTAERARDLGFSEVRVVGNKVRNGDQRTALGDVGATMTLPLEALVPYDAAVDEAITAGRAPIDAAPEGRAVSIMSGVAERLVMVHGEDGKAGGRR